MNYLTVYVKRDGDDQDGEKLSGDVQHALFGLNDDGYDLIDITAIQNGGQTVSLIISAKTRESQ
jgi:hypothetical protein